MIDAIHVGDYKTGTTWLQQQVFKQHPELIYIDCPRTYPEIARLFYELVDARDLDFDSNSLRERIKVQINKIDRTGKKLIVSREVLSGEFISGEHAKRNAERLYQVFGPTKILYVIREQFSMLASIYSQYVKMGGTLSINDFIWDPLIAKNLINRLLYEKQIQAYVEIFGADNVLVKVYEEMRRDKALFLNGMYSFMGCGDTDYYPVEEKYANPSLTTVGVAFQRILNCLVRTKMHSGAKILPFDKIVAFFLTSNQKAILLRMAMIQLPEAPVTDRPKPYLFYAINMGLNHILSKWCENIRIGGKIKIPAEVHDYLKPIFMYENQKLIRVYGLNLENYGWVL